MSKLKADGASVFGCRGLSVNSIKTISRIKKVGFGSSCFLQYRFDCGGLSQLGVQVHGVFQDIFFFDFPE